jgi:cardiolipin synthase
MPGFDSPEGRSGAIFSTGRRPAAEETDKMQTQQLQQNMKEKVKVFEDGGIRLLKKGQKGLVHAIFSRFGLVLVLLLLQFGALFSLLRWFGQLLPHYLGGTALVTAAMVIYLLNIDMDNSVRITWLVVIAVLPVLGVPLFWYTKADIGHNALKKRLMDLESQTRAQLPQPEGVEQRLEADSPGAASLARYLRGRGGGFPVYGNTAVTYFNGGEAKFAELLRQLETAEHYIFLEYFIIDEGLMWGRILEVLARKAAGGVDVRVMYDGTCEFSTLPRDYPKRLEALGIRCKVFAPVTPFVSTHYNYRDHRKILVIDGRVGFTGGVNLADEYINHVEKYGRWKDAAVMLEGEGVRSMTALFLQMWSVLQEPEFAQFLRPEVPAARAEGFVVPYGDCPLDGERVGEMVYIDLLNRARKYVHIITPYLILDGELETALRFAAERGVDVHLILPGVPDKQFAYALAKTHYKALLSSGVKISEWTPGFTHAKLVVMDGVEAVVGTINLDYRSLYHHFENAVWMRRVGSIRDMETDFQNTLARCRTVGATLQSVWQGKKLLRLMGLLLKVIAPLM